MQIEERTVGSVKVLDVKGQITQGDLLLKDKINSVINRATSRFWSIWPG